LININKITRIERVTLEIPKLETFNLQIGHKKPNIYLQWKKYDIKNNNNKHMTLRKHKKWKTYDSPPIYKNHWGFSWTHLFHHWNVAKNRSACFLNLCVTNNPYAPLPCNTRTNNNQHNFCKHGKINKYWKQHKVKTKKPIDF